MTKSIAIPDEVIVNKIYYVRGQKVMIDRDLAELYGVKPIRLREQVKRNIDKSPKHFMFQLTGQEAKTMVSQNAIPSKQHLGGSLPLVFSEHGVLMLANILKSKRAIQVSIYIIEVFVKLREMLLTHKDILLKLEQLEKKIMKQDKHLKKHEKGIEVIFTALKELLNPPEQPRKRIGYRKSKDRD